MNSHARAGLLLLTLCALGLAGAGCQTAGLPPVEEVALEPAALRGDADAQNDVGILYVETHTGGSNLTESVRWFRKAADQGLPAAQYNLGASYRAGRGVSQDPAEAVAWFRKAAYQGHARAQHTLARMYASGEGVARDDAVACAWLELAAPAMPQAALDLDALKKTLSAEAVAESGQRAQDLRARIKAPR